MRIFSAFNFDKDTKDYIYSMTSALRKNYPNIKWVKKENLHMTIKFYGDIEKKHDLESIKEKTNTIKDLTDNIVFKLMDISHFNFRVLYVKCVIPEHLIDMIKKTNATFKPHITIARIKDNYPLKEKLSLLKECSHIKIRKDIRKINTCVFKSILKPTGPKYREIN